MESLTAEESSAPRVLSYAPQPKPEGHPVGRRLLAGCIECVVSLFALMTCIIAANDLGMQLVAIFSLLLFAIIVLILEMCDADFGRLIVGLKLTFPDGDSSLRRLTRAPLMHPLLMSLLLLKILVELFEMLPLTLLAVTTLVGAVCLADLIVLIASGRRVGDILTGARIVVA